MKANQFKEFSDEELAQFTRFGQALMGGITPFDEAVEYYLNRYEREANTNPSRR
jgi:hypothetical protein